MAKKKSFENIISNILGEPVSNLCHAFYDQYVEANVRFRSKAGMKAVIIRRQLGKCCDWCADLAGIYTPENAPADIYRRHDNCKCMVTYKDEDGYQDVWSKKEFKNQREARSARELELMNSMEQGRLKRIERLKQEAEELRLLLKEAITIGTPKCNLDELFSESFRTKFKSITKNPRVNDIIRRNAQAILVKNNNTYTETLIIFDSRNGKVLVRQQGKKNALGIELTDEQKKIIKANKGHTIAIHNHPTNLYPTGSDFITAAQRQYDFGIVVTHDGRVIKYKAPVKPTTARQIDDLIDNRLRLAYNDDEEKRRQYLIALNKLQELFRLSWQEL